MENKISTKVFTHKIFYKDGNIYADVKITEEEANNSMKAWKQWRPVPVPNKKDKERSCRMMNPQKIDEIARFRYIS